MEGEYTVMEATKLMLGGHSFFSELASDPEPSDAEKEAIVTECLNLGIHGFDTTYYQERVHLGRILEELGRREEAMLMACSLEKLRFALPGREESGASPCLRSSGAGNWRSSQEAGRTTLHSCSAG
ncbi:hypothetical protein B2K_10740 [Paenibacillus mucilaginosus K02]|uniref:NADP-dependent oxidoreductase domain-containing protein n=1 Tax=Paenibacillus mucilaginosus K02 TaxID=997761 RepID=I0BFP5_9BACL|nr:hypothetical protein B2K_10740 [Paenibacillus mucilaginosus K02]